MNSLSVDVNNGGTMIWTQHEHDGSVTLQTGTGENIITAGELVMLANYYRNCKQGLEQSDYIRQCPEYVNLHPISPSNMVATNASLRMIATIQGEYVRDTQVYLGNPEEAETDADWDDKFIDMRNPCQYIGIFTGKTEDEIKEQAAEHVGVHPGVIALIDISSL